MTKRRKRSKKEKPKAGLKPSVDHASGLPAKRKLSLKKKFLFSMAACCLFFLTLELVLFACGVQTSFYDEDPYVGFSSQTPLFVEATNVDGEAVMVTAPNKLRFFNEQTFLKQKPAGTFRIFCLGGSTTYGRPYNHQTSFGGWLSEFLKVADPTGNCEVINAGGISYASYRVALLMDELNQYEPDLYMVYTGHNEFLERRTYGSLMGTPAPLVQLNALMSRTRIFSFARRQFYKMRGNPAPQNGQKDVLPEEVEPILNNTIGPESYTRDEQLQENVLEHLQFNLRRMVRLAHSAGAKVVFVTPAANIRDFSPFKSEHRAGMSTADESRWKSLYETGRTLSKNGRYERALQTLDEAATIDDRYADLHYRRGRVLDSLKRFDESRTAYLRALNEDVCPLRALSAIQDIVRNVAIETGSPLVDFHHFLDKRAKDGIPGEDFFLDHVHPTIDGHRLLALELFHYLVQAGSVVPDASWSDQSNQDVVRTVESRIDSTARGNALRNLSQVLSWAGKRAEADQLAMRAVKLAGDDGQTNYIAGHSLFNSDDYEQAVPYLKKAIELDHHHVLARLDLGAIYLKRDEFEKAQSLFHDAIRLNPELSQSHVSLGRLFAKQGKLAEATASFRRAVQCNPENASAIHNLGIALVKQGNEREAVACFTRAIEIRPRYASAHINLGKLMARKGRLSQAAEHFEEALRIDPQNVSARKNLKRTQEFSR